MTALESPTAGDPEKSSCVMACVVWTAPLTNLNLVFPILDRGPGCVVWPLSDLPSCLPQGDSVDTLLFALLINLRDDYVRVLDRRWGGVRRPDSRLDELYGRFRCRLSPKTVGMRGAAYESSARRVHPSHICPTPARPMAFPKA